VDILIGYVKVVIIKIKRKIYLMKNLIYHQFKEREIIKEGHFKLTSGKHSDKYINKDKILLYPELYSLIIDKFVTQIEANIGSNNIDVVTGPAVAGISFASPLAIRLNKSMVYPEKGKKWKYIEKDIYDSIEDAMVFRDVFKTFLKGKKVLIVEDIVTTGLSIKQTIQSILEVGGEIIGILCIWNRDPKVNNIFFGNKNYTLYSLISEEVQSWEKDECPLCKNNISLFNPKNNEIL
jgi:orotate phosphoribosyltransferase